ncbi:hypothetical protein ACPCTO_16310 [Streptomyces olivoreticuli]
MKISRIATVIAAGVIAPVVFLSSPALAYDKSTAPTTAAEQNDTTDKAVISAEFGGLFKAGGDWTPITLTLDNSRTETDFGTVGLPFRVDFQHPLKKNAVEGEYWSETTNAWEAIDTNGSLPVALAKVDKRSTVTVKLRFRFLADVPAGKGTFTFERFSLDMAKWSTTDPKTHPDETVVPFTVTAADAK